MSSFRNKVIGLDQLKDWRKRYRASGRRLVVTNGCFDILHLGHAIYLESASALGDDLLVGVNGDESVRQLKGEGRPVNPEMDRAELLGALACVQFVCVFPDVSAAEFLRLAAPDVYAKGGDYTLETLNQTEREIVEEGQGEIRFIPFLEGRSTSSTIDRARLG